MTAFEETPRKLPLLEFHQDPQAEQKVKEEKEDDDDKPRGSPLRPTRSATSSSALALKENVNSENLKAADGVEDDHIDAESEADDSASGAMSEAEPAGNMEQEEEENENDQNEDEVKENEDDDKEQEEDMKPEYNDDGNNKDKDHQKETKEDRQKDEGEVEAVAPAAVLETTTADETLLDTVPAQASQIQADPEPVINQIAQKGVAENTDTVAAIQDTIQDEGTTHCSLRRPVEGKP